MLVQRDDIVVEAVDASTEHEKRKEGYVCEQLPANGGSAVSMCSEGKKNPVRCYFLEVRRTQHHFASVLLP